MTPPLPNNPRVCAQPGCPTISSGRYCPAHTKAREQQRGTFRERGYDTRHDREAKAAKAKAIRDRALCPRCGLPILEGQALDYGHTVDRAADPTSRADRVEHTTCNRSAGGRLAH